MRHHSDQSELLKINDPEIDIDEIMEEIRDRIRHRRKEQGEPRTLFPSFGVATYPGEPDREDFDVDLYYHLRKANELYWQRDLEPVLAPSVATRIPVIGPLWRKVRREAHNLVLFYVNRLARQEIYLEKHLVSVVNRLAAQVEAQRAEIEELRRRIIRDCDSSNTP
ncbi:MAG: hypothetical protein ACP5HG_13275 [Anaerolineae bacterium]